MGPEANDPNLAALRRWLSGDDAAFEEWLGSPHIDAAYLTASKKEPSRHLTIRSSHHRAEVGMESPRERLLG